MKKGSGVSQKPESSGKRKRSEDDSYDNSKKPNVSDKSADDAPPPPAPPVHSSEGLKPPEGAVIAVINWNEIPEKPFANEKDLKIKKTKYVASYNWLQGQYGPEILVPGSPRQWARPAVDVKLWRDSGDYFKDQNAARWARPMEPAFQALLATERTFNLRGTNLLACSHTMMKLLRFVLNPPEAFRIIAELVDETVTLIRVEESPTELIPNVVGYNHSLTDAYTKWEPDVEGSESHQRIVRYKFAGLNILVRAEVDGYKSEGQQPPSNESKTLADEPGTSAKNLRTGIAPMALSTAHEDSILMVKKGGTWTEQSKVYELKTRAHHKDPFADLLGRFLPKLWVTRVPTFVVAYHNNGTFEEIRGETVNERLAAWEEEKTEKLKDFGGLLHKIIDLVKCNSNKRVELVHREPWTKGMEVLDVDVDVPACVSPEILDLWRNSE